MFLALIQCMFLDASDDLCIKETQQSVSKLSNEIRQLEFNVSKLNKTVFSNYIKQFKEPVIEIHNLTTKLDFLNTTFIEQQSNITELRTGVYNYFKELNETIDRHQKLFQTLQPQLATLANQVLNHTSEISQLQKDWDGFNNTVTIRENDLKNYSDLYINLSGILNSQEEKLSQIEQKNNLLEADVDNTKANNEVFNEFLSNLSSEQENLEGMILELRRELDAKNSNPVGDATEFCDKWIQSL